MSNIRTDDNRISFDVDTVGKPVLVKASYFPNWKADGAKGPYRVTPNQMVVIPTSKHVSLHYQNTPVDWMGWLLTLLGIAGLILLVRAGRVRYPDPPRPMTAAFEPEPEEAPAAYYAHLDGQLDGVDALDYWDDPVPSANGRTNGPG